MTAISARATLVPPVPIGPVAPPPGDFARRIFADAVHFAEAFYPHADPDRLALAVYEYPEFACQIGYLLGLMQGTAGEVDVVATWARARERSDDAN